MVSHQASQKRAYLWTKAKRLCKSLCLPFQSQSIPTSFLTTFRFERNQTIYCPMTMAEHLDEDPQTPAQGRNHSTSLSEAVPGTWRPSIEFEEKVFELHHLRGMFLFSMNRIHTVTFLNRTIDYIQHRFTNSHRQSKRSKICFNG